MNKSNIVVEVSSQFKIEKPLKKDANGFYENVPLALLDRKSRNKTFYESASFINCLKDDQSSVVQRLKQGVLFGEWDHPFLAGMDREKATARFVRIDPERKAISISKLKVKQIPNVGMVVLGSVKGSGPYGKYFEESMEDPSVNSAFSLRALTQDRPEKDYVRRKTLALITFDAGMAGGGFEEAAKDRIHVYSQESLDDQTDIDVNASFFTSTEFSSEFTENDIHTIKGLSSESLLTYEEIEKIFGSIKIIQGSRIVGAIDRNGNIIPKDDPTQRRSQFGTFFNS